MTALFDCSLYLLVLLFISANLVNSRDISIEERIKNDPDLSEFYSLLERNPGANSSLQFKSLTVFAPTNQAFQNYRSNVAKESLVSYHMATVPLPMEMFVSGNSYPTEYEGSSPIWITKRNRNDVYINNAKIQSRQHVIGMAGPPNNRKKQVLHTISEVLEPVISINPGSTLYSPDAFTFLNQSENIDLGKHRVRSFRQRVVLTNKSQVFSTPGKYTFFIPVEEGFQKRLKRELFAIAPHMGGSIFSNVTFQSIMDVFKPAPRPDKIDAKVIDGHVVPDHVLFTGPTPQGKEYETLAFGDMMKVTVSFTQQNDGKHNKMYVKSNTIVGDQAHPQGVVLAEIVRANIPVSNGVVHLIHRPLMVVDADVHTFLKEKADGPLYRFYQVIMEYGGSYIDKLTRMRELTLFAPSNQAWNESYMDKIFSDKTKMREILDLHLVEMRLPLETIIHNNAKEVPTAAHPHNLYFNVVQGPHNKTLTVEGGGVNATVVQPDIAATNGIVHIIDRVLGVPFGTIADKLRTDPMLNKTYFLGQRTSFNDQLDNHKFKYTYFVPRDYAWTKAEVQYPSAHKKLFMPEYSYHVEQILQRHLVVSEQAYTMADLKRMSNDTVSLSTVRDSLKIRVKEADRTGGVPDDRGDSGDVGGHGFEPQSSNHVPRKGYQIEWRGEQITVFRPDVHCTNGIIHVIDRVLLQESDVRVNGEPALTSLSVIINLFLVFFAKFYLD